MLEEASQILARCSQRTRAKNRDKITGRITGHRCFRCFWITYPPLATMLPVNPCMSPP
jgi:hypothetical protein